MDQQNGSTIDAIDIGLVKEQLKLLGHDVADDIIISFVQGLCKGRVDAGAPHGTNVTAPQQLTDGQSVLAPNCLQAAGAASQAASAQSIDALHNDKHSSVTKDSRPLQQTKAVLKQPSSPYRGAPLGISADAAPSGQQQADQQLPRKLSPQLLVNPTADQQVQQAKLQATYSHTRWQQLKQLAQQQQQIAVSELSLQGKQQQQQLEQAERQLQHEGQQQDSAGTVQHRASKQPNVSTSAAAASAASSANYTTLDQRCRNFLSRLANRPSTRQLLLLQQQQFGAAAIPTTSDSTDSDSEVLSEGSSSNAYDATDNATDESWLLAPMCLSRGGDGHSFTIDSDMVGNVHQQQASTADCSIAHLADTAAGPSMADGKPFCGEPAATNDGSYALPNNQGCNQQQQVQYAVLRQCSTDGLKEHQTHHGLWEGAGIQPQQHFEQQQHQLPGQQQQLHTINSRSMLDTGSEVVYMQPDTTTSNSIQLQQHHHQQGKVSELPKSGFRPGYKPVGVYLPPPLGPEAVALLDQHTRSRMQLAQQVATGHSGSSAGAANTAKSGTVAACFAVAQAVEVPTTILQQLQLDGRVESPIHIPNVTIESMGTGQSKAGGTGLPDAGVALQEKLSSSAKKQSRQPKRQDSSKPSTTARRGPATGTSNSNTAGTAVFKTGRQVHSKSNSSRQTGSRHHSLPGTAAASIPNSTVARRAADSSVPSSALPSCRSSYSNGMHLVSPARSSNSHSYNKRHSESESSLYCQRLKSCAGPRGVAGTLAPGVRKTDRVARYQQMQQQWQRDRYLTSAGGRRGKVNYSVDN